jgi:5-methylcytosine-specific restriction endonuclease McrA
VAAAPAAFARLLATVEFKLAEMPLPRLQRIGSSEDRFLYEVSWTDQVGEREFRGDGIDRRIRFVGRSAEHLVQLSGLVRPLVQRKWAAKVADLNSEIIQDKQIEEFLFGAERIPLDPVREPLRELQGGRCFYCEARLDARADVDHFIPWVRHADNGIENLVVAHARCNNAKSDFFASTEHVRKWKEPRFGAGGSHQPVLADIARRTRWERHPERTLAAGRALYLGLPRAAKLWRSGKEFANADRAALSEVFQSP